MRRLALLAPLLLAGCNSALPPPAPAASGYVSPVTAPGFKLPEGGGCSGEVARYRAIIDNDLAHGHIAASVHKTVSGEIDHAAAACSVGRDGEGLALIHASKERHGYPG